MWPSNKRGGSLGSKSTAVTWDGDHWDTRVAPKVRTFAEGSRGNFKRYGDVAMHVISQSSAWLMRSFRMPTTGVEEARIGRSNLDHQRSQLRAILRDLHATGLVDDHHPEYWINHRA